MTTTVHTMRMALGRTLICTVTEAPARIYVHISGDKPRRREEDAVKAFLRPIVSAWEDDDRPIEFDSSRSPAARVLHTIVRTPERVILGLDLVEIERPRAQA